MYQDENHQQPQRRVRRAIQMQNDGYFEGRTTRLPTSEVPLRARAKASASAPITTNQKGPYQQPQTRQQQRPPLTNAQSMRLKNVIPTVDYGDEDDDEELDDVIQYRTTPVVRGGTRNTRRNTSNVSTYKKPAVSKTYIASRFFLFIGAALVFILFIVVIRIALDTGTNIYNNMTYGFPRTEHVSAVVGHNDSALDPSYFIATNMKGNVVVIECPALDCSKSKVYIGPLVVSNNSPVTVSFQMLQGDTHPSMIVKFDSKEWILPNDGKQFLPNKSRVLLY